MRRIIRALAPVANGPAQLWAVRDVGELPRPTREAIFDALGHEAARRGLDANESPTDYGRELDALIDALRLDE